MDDKRDKDHALYTQYRNARRLLGFTNQRLADEVDVALTTIARELGVEPEKPMSLSLAQRLGWVLGFDPAYVALLHARDKAIAQLASAELGGRARARLRDVSMALRAAVRSFPRQRDRDPWRRLAARWLRCWRGLAAEAVARHVTDTPGFDVDLSAGDLRDFEHGYHAGPGCVLDTLRAALSALSPRLPAITRDDLDRRARALRRLHRVHETMEWRDARELMRDASWLECPRGGDAAWRMGTSPTGWPGLEVRIVEGRQPGRRASDRIQAAGQVPPGIHIGVVFRGAVEITISEQPFAQVTRGGARVFECEREAIAHQRRYDGGEVVVIQGGAHCRLVSHASRWGVAVVSLRNSVCISGADPSPSASASAAAASASASAAARSTGAAQRHRGRAAAR